MVILIAGASYTGKTLLAQKLLEIYTTPYLSIDHLKMGLYRSGIDYGFTPESRDEIITEKLWPIIKGIIMTNIENNQNVIIEGCYLPESLHDLDTKYVDEIIFLYIVFSESYIREHFLDKITGNRNIIENRIYVSEEASEFLEKYIVQNRNNKEKCIKNNIKYFEINENYEKETAEIFKWIDEEIKHKN